MVTADPLTLSLLCRCDVVYFTANGKIMSTEFGKVATNFFQCAISTSLRAALRMFSYRPRSVWVNQMTGGLLWSRPIFCIAAL